MAEAESEHYMYQILKKEFLNPTVVRMHICAPRVAKKAEPGQFVILRTDKEGERIPLTIADYNREEGWVGIVFQVVGVTTEKLSRMSAGDVLPDFVGPLGKPTETEGLKRVAIVGGGVGCAIAYPIARKLTENGCEVHSIIGFRHKDLVILEEDFRSASKRLALVTDDGTAGQKGLVTDALKQLIDNGEVYDRVIAIGPLVMMKFVSALTKKYNIPTVVSMNPVMIDGTGMCGGCRVSVGGKIRFACVEGPDFDGHLVDFDEAIARSSMYKREEREAYCRLLKGGDGNG